MQMFVLVRIFSSPLYSINISYISRSQNFLFAIDTILLFKGSNDLHPPKELNSKIRNTLYPLTAAITSANR